MIGNLPEIPNNDGMGPPGRDGQEIELRNDGTYVQYKLSNAIVWTNLVAIADLKGDTGEQGLQGLQGIQGIAGKEIELQNNSTYIQWKYSGEENWTNLVTVSSLKGDKGDKGDTGNTGSAGYTPIKGVDYFDGSQGTPGTNGTNGTDGVDGSQVQLQKTSEYVQWKYDTDLSWNNLIAIADLIGPQGIQGVQGTTGSTGSQGIQGIQGESGKSIEIQNSGTYIQWRNVGDTNWNNIVSIADITGPQGIQGNTGSQGIQGTQGIQGIQGIQGVKGDIGIGVPESGLTGQILIKNSNTSYDFRWADKSEIGVAVQQEFITFANESNYEEIVVNNVLISENSIVLACFQADEEIAIQGIICGVKSVQEGSATIFAGTENGATGTYKINVMVV